MEAYECTLRTAIHTIYLMHQLGIWHRSICKLLFCLFTVYRVLLPSCPENETLVNWGLKVTVGASRVVVAVMPLGVVYTSSEGASTNTSLHINVCYEKFFPHIYKLAMGHSSLPTSAA